MRSDTENHAAASTVWAAAPLARPRQIPAEPSVLRLFLRCDEHAEGTRVTANHQPSVLFLLLFIRLLQLLLRDSEGSSTATAVRIRAAV